MVIDFLWMDRKRRWGLPLSFTIYYLGEDRLFVTTGLFFVRDQQLLLSQVKTIFVQRSFIQWFFGVGTVTVVPYDANTPSVELVNVRNPRRVKELIHRQVKKNTPIIGTLPD